MTSTAITSRVESTIKSTTAADWLVGSAVIVLAPLLRELPPWVSTLYLLAVGLRFLHTHWHWPQPGRVLRGFLAILAGVLVYRYFGTLLGREPGVSMLVLLTGLKLLELRSSRDAALAALLLMLIVLGSFLYDNSLLLGLYTLFSVVAVTAGLVRIQSPALAPLAVARLAAFLVAQAIPLMLVTYLLFPRLPDALWGFQSADTHATTGIPQRMEPGAISALNISDAVAFRAYFDDDTPPPNRNLYWRVRIFWDTDGRTWEEGTHLRARDVLLTPGNPVHYRLVVEPSDKTWLPVLDVPAIKPPDLRARAGFVFETRRLQRERQTYDFVSYTGYRTGLLDSTERRRALALPQEPVDRVRGLVERWRAGARGDIDVVRAALRFFNTEPFVYTLTPPALGRDPVDQFLFDTRRGFCEHYAAAFVTLMRTAGIPARVVAGYQGGIYNPTGNYLIVRQSDAHAWAEVWLSASGWTRVDPTAAVAPSRIEYGIDAVRRLSSQGLPLNMAAAEFIRRAIELPWLARAWLRTRLTWDYLNFSWYVWVGNYSLERQTQFLAQIGLTNWSVPVMIAVLVQLVFIYALLQLRRRRTIDPVQRQYEKYCQKLKRVGVARAVSEGPISLARRANTKFPELAATIDMITALYVGLRYGSENSAGGARSLARAVNRFHPRAR